VRRVLWAGLIAGTIDIGAACLISRQGPEVILHNIASHLIGNLAAMLLFGLIVASPQAALAISVTRSHVVA
jgi:hypothetical protein